jgi:nucleotide-binding universal stress UspA family protein
MLRSILVALDDTPGAVAARDAAIALARRTGAALTVAVVLDRPGTQDEHEVVPVGGAAFKARRDAALTARAEQEAARALADCAAAAGSLPHDVLRLEDSPEPALVAASQQHDLLVIGRDSTLGRQETEDGVAPAISALLRDGARPLLVVPPGAGLQAEGPVLAGYDGSCPAMASLQLFALLGLAESQPVKVATVGEDRATALACAEQGAAYLRRHGLAAEALALQGGRPGTTLLAAAQSMGARLLVLGAFSEKGMLQRLFRGSPTQELLRDSPLPVFMHR